MAIKTFNSLEKNIFGYTFGLHVSSSDSSDGTLQYSSSYADLNTTVSGRALTLNVNTVENQLILDKQQQTVQNKKFVSSTISFAETATDTFYATFAPTSLSANRIITIPNFAGTLLLTEGNQTVNGTKTFTNSIVLSSASLTVNSNVYTIPNLATSSFVMSEGPQTINGDKTFTNAPILTSAALKANSNTYTIPNLASSSFILSEGTQSINGSKTFTSTLSLSKNLSLPSILDISITTAGQVSFGNVSLCAFSGSNLQFGIASNLKNNWSTYATNNIMFGTNAMSLVTPTIANNVKNNIAIGFEALNCTGTPNNNIAIGNTVMGAATTAYQNIMLGFTAGQHITSGFRNIGLGSNVFQATCTGSYNVGVGESSLLAITTGTNNVAVGSLCLKYITTGSYNVGLGAISSSTISTGSYNTVLNGATNGNYSGVVAIGTDSAAGVATATANNQIVLGTSTHRTYIKGYDTEAATAIGLTATDKIVKISSSARYKENITLLSYSSAIYEMSPKSFKYKTAEKINYGFIAEELAAIGLPALIHYDLENRPDSIDLTAIVALAVLEIQNLKKEIEALKNK